MTYCHHFTRNFQTVCFVYTRDHILGFIKSLYCGMIKTMKTTIASSLLLTLAATLFINEIQGQSLNGYINPMWTSDRRFFQTDVGVNDFWTSQNRGPYYSGSSRINYNTAVGQDGSRSNFAPTGLIYVDERGRYRPVYRQDRLFTVNQNYYRPNEPQQLNVPVSTGQPQSQIFQK